MNRLILLFLALSISCSSYQEAEDKKPSKNCGSDKSNTYVLCNIKLELKSGDIWSYKNYFIIEEYKYRLHEENKIEYQIILSLSLSNFAYYNTASLVIDGKNYTLSARKTEHDETYGLREILYFEITRDFLKILADSEDVLLIMPGKVTNRYSIQSHDIQVIKEFYKSL
jgi:hypothetical protein